MAASLTGMKVTCLIKYRIDRNQGKAFEKYGKMWIRLVNRMGGVHHGYLLPHEGSDSVAYAFFSFPSLARYEEYRREIQDDQECKKAFAFAKSTGCILGVERTFMRPVFE